MSVELLTEHHLEFLSLKGGCTGSSESTLVKMPHCLEITCRGSNISKFTFKVSISASADDKFCNILLTIREYKIKCSTDIFSSLSPKIWLNCLPFHSDGLYQAC